MLFETTRHETLRNEAWDEAGAKNAVRAIVDELQTSVRPDDFWPAHPLDEVDAQPTGQKTPAEGYGICHGTAGNGYAFPKLHRRTGDPAWLDVLD